MPNFCQLATTPLLKIQKFHLTTVEFKPKTFLILYPWLENSTTGIAIFPRKPFFNNIINFLANWVDRPNKFWDYFRPNYQNPFWHCE